MNKPCKTCKKIRAAVAKPAAAARRAVNKAVEAVNRKRRGNG